MILGSLAESRDSKSWVLVASPSCWFGKRIRHSGRRECACAAACSRARNLALLFPCTRKANHMLPPVHTRYSLLLRGVHPPTRVSFLCHSLILLRCATPPLCAVSHDLVPSEVATARLRCCAGTEAPCPVALPKVPLRSTSYHFALQNDGSTRTAVSNWDRV